MYNVTAVSDIYMSVKMDTSYNNSNVSVGYTPSFDQENDYFDLDFRAKKVLAKPDSVVALVFGLLAVTANVLSVLAICQVRLRLTARFRLIISLALSDTFVGLNVMLFYVTKTLNPVHRIDGSENDRLRSICIYMVNKALFTSSLAISIFNLLAMAIDHYIAIMKPLHYPTILSKERANVLIGVLWTAAFFVGFCDMLYCALAYHTLQDRDKYNFCDLTRMFAFRAEHLLFIISFVGMSVMIFVYVRIYIRVKKRQRSIPGEHLKQDCQRNGRALKTTLLILLTFALCWFPNWFFQITMLIWAHVDYEGVVRHHGLLTSIEPFLFDLWMLNSLCDPIIYTVRMCEVKCGYRRLFRKCCSCLFSFYNKNSDSVFYSINWFDKKASTDTANTDIGMKEVDLQVQSQLIA